MSLTVPPRRRPAAVEDLLEIGARVGAGRRGDLLRSPLGHDPAPFLPAFRAQVDNIVAILDDFKVVLDDDDRVAERGQLREDLEELADVVEMEPGRRFVEKIEGPAGGAAAELLGQLDALGLPS
jgi:hypothetical protein